MSSEVEPQLQRLPAWFDLESVAVVTILLGLFQVLLSVPLAFANLTLPKFFVLPLILGILIVAGGSFIIANERNSSRILLRGCACSNVVGLLGALLAFCLYCYSLSITHSEPCEKTFYDPYDINPAFSCPKELLTRYSWSVTLLLLLYDCGAVVVLSLLSVCSFRALNTH